MLLPKRVKYRRVHRGRLTGKAYSGNKVSNGEFGLQALEPAWITSRQIEAARSPTSPSPRSLPRPAWAPVKVLRNTGSPW